MNIKLIDEDEIKTNYKKYTDDELLEYIREFYRTNRRLPVLNDFKNNPKCPDPETYRKRFGSWNNALGKVFGIKRDKNECDRNKKYTVEELLDNIRIFEKERGRPPTRRNFTNNPGYPGVTTYIRYFGSWTKALKIVGLDVESMVKKGVIETIKQKSRLSEMIIRDHFEQHATDLSGENQNSPWDGICPNGMNFDVKSSSFRKGRYWEFSTNNKYKEEIEMYYFLAFNEDYSELMYAWRVPAWEVIGKERLYIGLGSDYEFNIKNMKEYDITDKFKDVCKELKIENK